MKKLLPIITSLVICNGAMAQNHSIYEWKDSISTIRATSEIDSFTFCLPENLIQFTTGSPTTLKKTSMTSSFSMLSAASFANPATTEQGICYSVSNPFPTIQDNKVKSGAFTKGSTEVTITGLKNNTYYFYRPYLIVADQVFYGPVKTFSTWEGADSQRASIYETLRDDGTYKTYLRLIADPETYSGTGTIVEALSNPGTRTVFAANDQAWENFFAQNRKLPKSNPWHYAQSYETLSKSQKRLLLNASLIDQAVSSESLSSTAGESPVQGENLRMRTNVEVVDSIAHIAVAELPITYWDSYRQMNEAYKAQPETDQWANIRNGNKKSIHLALDGSPSMMLHITDEYMKKQHITDEDFRIIMGQDRTSGDVHVYNARVNQSDILCDNGYIHMVSQPLVPTTNMAELVRTNGRTNIYSHMLDRFSVPFANQVLAEQYSKLNPNFDANDTLYTKRYYSTRSYGSTTDRDVTLNADENGNIWSANNRLLKFDPGWNGYFPFGETEESDMGAMFVPNDTQMLQFFNQGAGRTFLEEYTMDNRVGQYTIDNLETLYKDIDQIPLSVIQTIINIGMANKFTASVPSKMLNLRLNGTTEELFEEPDTRLTNEGGTIDTVLVACNGAVYIMNNMFTPSDFNCVATPAYVRSTNRIMRWAIYSDFDGSNYMGMNYYVYLKAMQSNISFFMPNDEALQYYYDPISFTSKQPRVMGFAYTSTGSFPFATKNSTKYPYVLRNFDVNTGTIGNAYNTQSTNSDEIVNRLRQMLEHNTVVHEGGMASINTDEDEYYLSKNGMGIKVMRDNNGVFAAQGGFQIENEREGLSHNHPGILYCNVIEKGNYKNGSTFTLDAPLIPASRSVFSVLSGMQRGAKGEVSDYIDENDYIQSQNPYAQFFRLCNEADWELIIKSGLVDETNPKYDPNTSEGNKALTKAVNRYMTFVDNNAVDFNVQFFSNYHYTVFAPTNDAILAAINKGLPTWESIRKDFDSCCDENGNLTTAADSARIQAKITYLTNFIRLHFVDSSVFADKSEFDADMHTNSYNRETGIWCKVSVQRVKQGGSTILKVKDNTGTGQWKSAVFSVDGRDVKNVMACDRVCNTKVKDQAMNGKTTVASSYSVIHLIDGVLNHTSLENGRYPTFENESKARQYMQIFAIP